MKQGLVALITLAAASGCGERYPQYTAHYELADLRYSEKVCDGPVCNYVASDYFKGGLSMPSHMEVDHYLDYIGTSFTHWLQFKAEPKNKTEASGSFAVMLSELTIVRSPEIGTKPSYGGTSLYLDRYYGTDVKNCFFGEKYTLFAPEMTGSAALMDTPDSDEDLYLGYKETYTDSEGHTYKLAFNNGDEIPIDEDKRDRWLSQVDDAGGMRIKLVVERHTFFYGPGCAEETPLLFPHKGAKMEAIYHSTNHESTLEDDIRERSVPKYFDSTNDVFENSRNLFFDNVIKRD